MAPASDRGTGEDLAVGGAACVLAGVAIFGASKTDEVAPIIAGSVAILVALITWYATDRRQSKAIAAQEEQQRRALEAERDRHEATIAAEAERHSARLRHEQRQQDIDELRRVLDATMEALAGELGAHTEARKAWLEADPESVERRRDAVSNLEASLLRVNAELYRLSLRMGSSHQAVRALGKAYVAAKAQRDIFDGEEVSADAQARLDEHGEAVRAALDSFRTAAVQEIQVRRDDSEHERLKPVNTDGGI